MYLRVTVIYLLVQILVDVRNSALGGTTFSNFTFYLFENVDKLN